VDFRRKGEGMASAGKFISVILLILPWVCMDCGDTPSPDFGTLLETLLTEMPSGDRQAAIMVLIPASGSEMASGRKDYPKFTGTFLAGEKQTGMSLFIVEVPGSGFQLPVTKSPPPSDIQSVEDVSRERGAQRNTR
jgi:hypothetical protein